MKEDEGESDKSRKREISDKGKEYIGEIIEGRKDREQVYNTEGKEC